MRNFIIALLVTLLLPLSPTLSAACSGVKFNFGWKEPKLNVDGTLLTDLSKTTLYYEVNGAIVKKNYTATTSKGGGSKSASVTIPMNCKTMINSVKAWTTSTNIQGLESGKSNELNMLVPIIANSGAAGGL